MPRFDPPDDQDLAGLIGTIVALEARVALLESVIQVGIGGSATIAAVGQLKLSSQRSIDLQVGGTVVKLDPGNVDVATATARFNTAVVDVNAAVVNAPSSFVRCNNLTANLVVSRGQPL
jgi:hypothetical protein